jgi:hypothetical protein
VSGLRIIQTRLAVSHCCVCWTGGVVLSLVCCAGGVTLLLSVGLVVWLAISHPRVLVFSCPHTLVSLCSHVLASVGLVAWLVVVAVCSGWGQSKEW